MTAAEELEILQPERELTVNGETIMVYEFSFLDGMAMAQVLVPMIADLGEMIRQDETGMDSLEMIFAKHQETWLMCMAKAARKDVNWVRSLSDEDGTMLSLTTWAVNKDFFIRRIVTYQKGVMMREKLAREQEAIAEAMSEPESSSPPSCPEDTA